MSVQSSLWLMSYNLKEDAREALNQANYHAAEEKKFRQKYEQCIREADNADTAAAFLNMEQPKTGAPA